MHSSPQLTSLPEKAVCTLLQHLNVWTLMNLRLVCKSTKAWVENPSVLKRMVVLVKEQRLLKDLVLLNIKWSNLQISFDNNDMTGSWIRSEEFVNALTHLKSSLKVLKFEEQRVPFNDGVSMVLQCSELEELHIGTLDLTKATVSEEITKNLGKLKKLVINYLAWDSENDLQCFPQILQKCESLQYLKLPYILSARIYSLYPSLDEDEIDQKLSSITNEYLFEPVKRILLKEDQASLKYIDVENFEFEEILESIAPACVKSGCLLLNVLEVFERPFTEQEKNLCAVVGSLINCSKNMDLNALSKLKSIAIYDDCSSSSDIDKKHENTPLPSLTSVTLTLTKAILQSERLASCFLQQKRESVECVNVKFNDLKGKAQASVFRTPKFVLSVPNLKSLTLDGFDGRPHDYLLLWKNFTRLECLQLIDCGSLNDLAIIGDEVSSPAFLNLKCLRRLSLENGDFSDAVLEVVISKLMLETLTLNLPNVRRSGLSSLLKSQLTSSLMVFNCMKPEDSTEKHMKNFFSKFVNLKKSEILF